MVRRLKEDLRQIKVQLPERLVVPEVIDGLPAENLVISNLQKRLLSSIAAFDRTLQVHCTTIKKRSAHESRRRPPRLEALDLLAASIDGDDERAEGDEEELLQEADAQHEAAVRSALQATDDDWQLLQQMQEMAQAARYEPDSRVRNGLASAC